MENALEIFLSSSLIATIISASVAFLFHKRKERYNAEIKREFESLSQVSNNYFEWKKKTVGLLGKVYIHLNRSQKAFQNKYSKLKTYDPYFEDEIMFTSNKLIRDLLIENADNIPPNLLEEASKLIEHYDAWLIKYHKLRKIEMDTTTVQIYVGPDGFRFPEQAEEKFKSSYIELFNNITKNSESADKSLP